MPSKQPSLKWKPLPLIAGHLLVLFIMLALFPSPNTSIFAPIDRALFRFFNGWIANGYLIQNFFAMANHRIADWVEDGVFLGFFTWIIANTKKEERVRKIAESLFVILGAALVIFLSKAILFQSLFSVRRDSPTLVMDAFTSLSEKVTWLKVKAGSRKSFPGDHGTTALLSIVSFFYVARSQKKVRIVALLYGIFLTLPRLTVGAHWFSDIYLGSASTVFLFSLWAFCTPFAERSVRVIEMILRLGKKKDVKAHG